MSERDDKLEEILRALDDGQPIEQILEDDKNSSELGSLISLAESIREVPHPELNRQTIQAEKKRLSSAARDRKRARKRKQGTKVGGFTGQWLFVPAFAGLALILLMVFILASGVGIYFAGPVGAHYATLTDISGQIQVASSGQATEWYAVSEGERVHSRQRVRTGPDSWATLVYFDGTRTTLAPNSDLMLTEIDGNWGDVLQVTLIQNEGQTDHQVVPFESENAAYNVLTPTGSASVRGTEFRVIVGDTGKSLFTVNTGQVLVSNEGSQAYVNAGQGVVSELGKPLVSPTYLFVLQGVLEAKEGKTWTVEGAPFRVKGSTIIEGDPQVGAEILVQGRIRKTGWIADSIQGPLDEDRGGAFSGVVEDQTDNLWVVGGFELQVDDNPQDVEVGDAVRVTFEVLENDKWRATEIVLLDGESESPDSDVDDDDDDDLVVEEGLSFDKDEFEVSACDSIPTFTSILTYEPGGDDPSPLEVLLDFDPEEVTDDVEEILIKPAEAFTMNPGDSVEVTVTVTLNGDLTGLPEDSEVKIRVFTSSDAEDVNLKIELKCDIETEVDEEQDDVATCTGNDQHPKALKLEAEFSELDDLTEEVKYDRIMGWFCDENFGFGEIDQMVNLGARYGVAIEDIFELRDEVGLGWGQIKQQLAANDPDNEEYKNPAGKVPPGKIKSEENKNKDKSNKKGDD